MRAAENINKLKDIMVDRMKRKREVSSGDDEQIDAKHAHSDIPSEYDTYMEMEITTETDWNKLYEMEEERLRRENLGKLPESCVAHAVNG